MKDYLFQGSAYEPAKPIAYCATCGEIIRGVPIVRDEQRFCCTWHADQYRPPAPWWQRVFRDRGLPHGTDRG